MNITIRAKDSFVHNTISMDKRETRSVPEAIATSLIKGGLADEVKPQRATRAAGTKVAPVLQNKRALDPANKAATDADSDKTTGQDDSASSTSTSGASVVVNKTAGD